MERDDRAVRPELARLFEEVVRCYLRLNRAASLIHRRGDRSGAQRTVLVTLARTGPMSVAQIARLRAEPRQRLQPLVNRLLNEAVLARLPNPAHKRSPLVALTPKGEALVRRIAALEATLRARLEIDATPQAFAAAAATLARVREALERPDTIQMLKSGGRAKR